MEIQILKIKQKHSAVFIFKIQMKKAFIKFKQYTY